MSALGIDIKLLVAQIVNFIIFFILVKKFIAKPFLKYLKDQQKIAEEKELALINIEKQKTEIELEKQKIIERTKNESISLIKETKNDLETLRAIELKKIQDELSTIKSKTYKQIEEDRRKMIAEVRSYIIETSSLLVKKALSDYLDEDKQKEVIKYIVRLSKDNKYEN